MANTANNGKILGSPGTHLSDADFIDAISGGDGPDDVSYRLPEFVTSFLLAKDIEMEIKSKSSALFQSVVQSTHSTHSGGNFLVFSSSHSTQDEQRSSRTGVHKTNTGMKIKIAGAQVIGYYTQKIPKFPLTS